MAMETINNADPSQAVVQPIDPVQRPGRDVVNALLFLVQALNSLTEKQLVLGEVESESAKIMGNAEIKLSNALLQTLQLQAQHMQDDANGDTSDPDYQAQLQVDSTNYSTTEQQGQMNLSTLQTGVQQFNTSVQMVMQAMQSMMGLFDAVSGKLSFDASLTAS